MAIMESARPVLRRRCINAVLTRLRRRLVAPRGMPYARLQSAWVWQTMPAKTAMGEIVMTTRHDFLKLAN
jgi:hypothetical protein